jgi:peptide-methionine (R)-S-oxide reductase
MYIIEAMRERLKKENPKLYHVAWEGGTEPPFTGRYVYTKDEGVYHCAVCKAVLFSSAAKFDSGTGWPSFTDPIFNESVTFQDDYSHGMVRTEVRCANCDAHLGHVFMGDGPEIEGKTCARFCVNSISLDFKENNGTLNGNYE